MRNWRLSFILLALLGWLVTMTIEGAVMATPAETRTITATPTPDPAHDPAVTPIVSPEVTISPTIDRLAAPPTVKNPNQADEGAQLFWLHCQPCHGDVGQGLTDEWREQYPEEDQNCWNSGCHGSRPYENGFTLPTFVPAVTGEESLERFETVGQLYGFISSTMPYQDPGYLTEEEYLAMTAFLARAHDAWDGTPLTAENVGNFRLRPGEATATPMPTSTPAPSEGQNNDETGGDQDDSGGFGPFIVGVVAGVIGSLILIAVLAKRRL